MKVATIDVGTNSTRLLVADVNKEKKVTVKYTDLKTTRLGEGISASYLNEMAMERTVEAIEVFVKKSQELKVEYILIAATSAVRDAANRQIFVDLVWRRTGLRLSVLAGEDEAKMSYRGVLAGLDGSSDGVVVLDVGGGSTELSWKKSNDVSFASVNVGAVRMTEGGHSDQEISTLLKPMLNCVNKNEVNCLVAVGGTATTIAAMIQQLETYDPKKVHGFVVKREQLEQVLFRLNAMSIEERQNVPGLQPERADIIIAGLRIIFQVLDILGLQQFTVSESDILWGLAIRAAVIVDKKNSTNY